MRSLPLVSIALCTYNGERFLSEQIESILSQTYRNLEIIAVDDNSTDNTLSVLNTYSSKDPRLKVFKNEKNLGFNKNFEKAISLTSGDLIAISDQDDIWSLNKIELLAEGIADNWLIFSNSSLIDIDGKKTNGLLLKETDVLKISYKAFLLNNFVTGHTALFHKKLIDYCFPIPENGFYDWWMGFIAIYHNKLKYIDYPLTFYRIHDNSAMHNIKTSNKYFECKFEQLKEFSNYKNLQPSDKKFIGDVTLAFEEKKNKLSFKLLKLIYKNYTTLFPHLKYRWGISRLNFAFRLSKKVQY